MRRILALVIPMCLLVVLGVGCHRETAENNQAPKEETPATSQYPFKSSDDFDSFVAKYFADVDAFMTQKEAEAQASGSQPNYTGIAEVTGDARIGSCAGVVASSPPDFPLPSACSGLPATSIPMRTLQAFPLRPFFGPAPQFMAVNNCNNILNGCVQFSVAGLCTQHRSDACLIGTSTGVSCTWTIQRGLVCPPGAGRFTGWYCRCANGCC